MYENTTPSQNLWTWKLSEIVKRRQLKRAVNTGHIRSNAKQAAFAFKTYMEGFQTWGN